MSPALEHNLFLFILFILIAICDARKCASDSCIEIAKIFRKNMNPSFDPCDDFFTFACGNSQLPENMNFTHAMASKQNDINELLIKELLQEGSKDEGQLLKFVRKLFQKARNKIERNKNDFRKWQEFVEQLGSIEKLENLVKTHGTGASFFLQISFQKLEPEDQTVKDFITFGPSELTLSNDLLTIETLLNTINKPEEANKFLEEALVALLTRKLPNVMGRFYIDAVGMSERTKLSVIAMVAEIKKSFGQMIDEKEWMDTRSKKLAKEKLHKTKVNVAYPDWIRDDNELNKSFDLKFTEDEDAFDLILKLNRWLVKERGSKFNPTSREDNWRIPLTQVNALYAPFPSSIFVPAAIIGRPFYDDQLPRYINYGALGSIIGHELVHAFDNNGLTVDADGRPFNWSSEMQDAFKKLVGRMVNQYSSTFDDRVNRYLNGTKTVNEDISDNGGVRAAFDACFHKDMDTDTVKLPEFEDWSDEQMFFLAYANNCCEVGTKKMIEHAFLTKPHTLGKFRVNVPLSNLQQFAQAYRCKSGSKMNPEGKVKVW